MVILSQSNKTNLPATIKLTLFTFQQSTSLFLSLSHSLSLSLQNKLYFFSRINCSCKDPTCINLGKSRNLNMLCQRTFDSSHQLLSCGTESNVFFPATTIGIRYQLLTFYFYNNNNPLISSHLISSPRHRNSDSLILFIYFFQIRLKTFPELLFTTCWNFAVKCDLLQFFFSFSFFFFFFFKQ